MEACDNCIIIPGHDVIRAKDLTIRLKASVLDPQGQGQNSTLKVKVKDLTLKDKNLTLSIKDLHISFLSFLVGQGFTELNFTPKNCLLHSDDIKLCKYMRYIMLHRVAFYSMQFLFS